MVYGADESIHMFIMHYLLSFKRWITLIILRSIINLESKILDVTNQGHFDVLRKSSMTTTQIAKLPLSVRDQLVLGIWPRGLSSSQAIPLAAAQARVLVREERLPESVNRLVQIRESLFERLLKTQAVEEDLQKTLQLRLDGINTEISIRELTDVFELPTLNPSFLSWKNESGYPAFSVYHMDSPVSVIEFWNTQAEFRFLNNVLSWTEKETAFKMVPEIPNCMIGHYLDHALMEVLKSECIEYGLRSVQLSARYSGAMPEEVCDKIQSVRGKFDDMFIVAQAPRWKRNTVSAIRPGDPLVIGISNNILWLVAAYDLTPVEKVAMQIALDGESGEFRSKN